MKTDFAVVQLFAAHIFMKVPYKLVYKPQYFA